MRKMTPSVRKLALTAHVTTSVGWLGAVGCFLALSVAGLTSQQHHVVQAAYVGMSLTCWFVIIPLSIASPVSGVVQSLGTSWGLFRHYWVLVKLLVTVPCSAILLLHMLPTSELAAAAAQGQLMGDALRELRIQLVADAVIALVVLVFATVLAIYKPAGQTAYGVDRTPPEGQTETASHAAPRWIVWLRRLAIATGVIFLAAHLAGKGLGGHGGHFKSEATTSVNQTQKALSIGHRV